MRSEESVSAAMPHAEAWPEHAHSCSGHDGSYDGGDAGRPRPTSGEDDPLGVELLLSSAGGGEDVWGVELTRLGARANREESREEERELDPDEGPSTEGAVETDEGLSIELTKEQIDGVIRSAGRGGPMAVLLTLLWDASWTQAMKLRSGLLAEQLGEQDLAPELLSGLLVFSCFRPNGAYRTSAEVEQLLRLDPDTVHRCASTLVAVGLLEHDSELGMYRSAKSG
jgi:hypothetical protein